MAAFSHLDFGTGSGGSRIDKEYSLWQWQRPPSRFSLRPCILCELQSTTYVFLPDFLTSYIDRWGFPFIQHSYLYHVGRTDHRHNFSVYFYPLYLGLVRQDSHGSPTGQSKLLSLVAFLPQVLISIGGGFHLAWALIRAHTPAKSIPGTGEEARKLVKSKGNGTETASHVGLEHLPFIFLLQTFTFVTFNKVCTSQYFMWYLWFLPLVIPRLLPAPDSSGGISAMKGGLMVALWVAAQALWLSQGYRLEFLGEGVFVELWTSGVIMLGINAWLVVSLVNGYRWV
jgi:phosphatidylinositol glycan class M